MRVDIPEGDLDTGFAGPEGPASNPIALAVGAKPGSGSRGEVVAAVGARWCEGAFRGPPVDRGAAGLRGDPGMRLSCGLELRLADS